MINNDLLRFLVDVSGIITPLALLIILLLRNRENNGQKLRTQGLQASDDNRAELRSLRAGIEDDKADAKRRERVLLAELEDTQADTRRSASAYKQSVTDSEALAGRVSVLTQSNQTLSAATAQATADVATLRQANLTLTDTVTTQGIQLGKKDSAFSELKAIMDKQVETGNLALATLQGSWDKESNALKDQVSDLIKDRDAQATSRFTEREQTAKQISDLTDAAQKREEVWAAKDLSWTEERNGLQKQIDELRTQVLKLTDAASVMTDLGPKIEQAIEHVAPAASELAK